MLVVVVYSTKCRHPPSLVTLCGSLCCGRDSGTNRRPLCDCSTSSRITIREERFSPSSRGWRKVGFVSFVWHWRRHQLADLIKLLLMKHLESACSSHSLWLARLWKHHQFGSLFLSSMNEFAHPSHRLARLLSSINLSRKRLRATPRRSSE